MISHTNKFIFIHIPKTGGTSVEAALADYGKLLQGPGNFHSIYFKHIPATRLQAMMGDEYENYFKFSIVRNPWDWLVSMYEFCRGFCYPFIYDTPYSLRVPDEFRDMPFDEWIHWFHRTFRMQQCEIITGRDKTIAVNKIFRFEDLEGFSEEISKILSINTIGNLPKLKNSTRKEFSFYYSTGTTIDAVSDYFSTDVEMFGYKFDEVAV